jgi:hypothetical protein
MVLFENKKLINNLNYEATSMSIQFKNSWRELFLDPKTDRIADPAKFPDKTKLVRLNSAKWVEALEWEYMFHKQI